MRERGQRDEDGKVRGDVRKSDKLKRKEAKRAREGKGRKKE